MITEGKHRAKAKEWALGETGTNKEQIGICFDLLDLPGEEITYYGFFTEKGLPITVKAMRACGWQGADLTDLTGLDSNEVTLVIEEEEYPPGSDEFAMKVKWVNSGGGLVMNKTLDEGGVKSFAARMLGAILALDPSSAAKHAAAKRQQPRPSQLDGPPHDDSDAPPF